MKRAREILHDYLERREPGVSPDPALQDENLRRLLRYAAAARQPSERFETDLLAAMQQAGAVHRSAPCPGLRWPSIRPSTLRVWSPIAALALVSLALAWQLRHAPRPIRIADVPVATDRRSQATDVSPRPRPALIGYVLLPEGELLRREAGKRDWAPVEGGMALHLGDTLRTDATATGSVVFRDGSVCRLAASTTLEYAGPYQADIKRPSELRLTRGETWNQVEKGGPEFRVVAPAATAVVHGTTFTVAVGPNGQTTLRVQEGKVELRNALASVPVRAGMQSMARAGEPPGAAVPLPRPVKSRPAVIASPGGAAAHPKDPGAGGLKLHLKMQRGDARKHPTTKPAPPKEPAPSPDAPIESSGAARDERTAAPFSTGR